MWWKILQGTGKRAWWLGQFVVWTPPAVLTEISGMEPADFIEAAAKSEYGKTILSSLLMSAAECADQVWCAALVSFRIGQEDMQALDIAPLWQCLPTPAREELLTEVFRHSQLKKGRRGSCSAGATICGPSRLRRPQ